MQFPSNGLHGLELLRTKGRAELRSPFPRKASRPPTRTPSSGLTWRAHKVTKCISVLTASSSFSIWDPATVLSRPIQRWASTRRQKAPQSLSWGDSQALGPRGQRGRRLSGEGLGAGAPGLRDGKPAPSPDGASRAAFPPPSGPSPR